MGKHRRYYHEFYVIIASNPNDNFAKGNSVSINAPTI
jgi:hypothetical protein